MTAIVNISAEHRTATVQPGVVNAHLNQALAKSHPQLFYAPDPSSQSACTLGGNIAENAGGIHCIAYGVTGDHILALEVVLPNGEVVWTCGHSPECPGIDLTGIVVGSEGTLGIVTQAVVQLLEKPPGTRVYLASFATVNDAAQTVSSIIAQGLSPTALEFMDAFTVRAVNAAFQVGFPEASQAVLLIELSGPHVWLDGQHTALNSLLQEHQVLHVSVAKTDAENQKLWAARKGAVAAYGRLQPAFYVHDCVIPRHQLAPMLAKIEAISQEYQVPIGNVFHAGDGNLHPNILFDPSDADMVSRVVAAGDAILKACLAVGGTLTGEHGIGIEKSKYMRMQFSEADLQAMAFVKHAFDPGQLSNPHKIFPIHGGCGEARHQPEALKNLMAAYPVWI